MDIEIDGFIYESIYFPFYRIKKTEWYTIYGIRYPSGFTEKVIVVDSENHIKELKNYSEFLIREYILENNESLTVHGERMKRDVEELFRRRPAK